MKSSNDDTIVAVGTPVGEGGIGIIRLSGRDSIKLADKIFVSSGSAKPSQFKTHTIHYGHIVGVDEVLLTVMRAPKTYTKEDVVEINCHGGMTALRGVLEILVRYGARIAEPGEFTKRAFLNGRIDLAQAEAVLDIIRAKTDAGLRVSVNQLNGELSREIDLARSTIIDICAELEAAIDFPDEDIEVGTAKGRLKKIKAVRGRLEGLAGTYHDGAILKDGITAVICGRANVGKSSLMNLLLKRDRVIVTHMPGTTRDAIEELVSIKGIPIRLVDTAGIRKQKGAAERAGMDKSRSYVSDADLILCVLDGSRPLNKYDKELLKNADGKCAIIIINKYDLGLAMNIKDIRKISKGVHIIKISCLDKEGIDRLEDEVYNKVWNGGVRSSHGSMLNNIRHKSAIDKAIDALARAEDALKKNLSGELISIDIRESVNSLGEIVGEVYNDDILNVIFSKFCIGK